MIVNECENVLINKNDHANNDQYQDMTKIDESCKRTDAQFLELQKNKTVSHSVAEATTINEKYDANKLSKMNSIANSKTSQHEIGEFANQLIMLSRKPQLMSIEIIK